MTLTLLILLPLVGAFATALTPSGGTLPQRVAAAFSLATLAFTIGVAVQFHPHDGGQFTEDAEWIKPLGAHYALSLDGLGLLLVLLTTVITPIAIAASWRDTSRAAYFSWALALEGLALTVFLADDLLLFYIAFEATLIPAYFLIGGWGRSARAQAALKFLLFQLGGGLVLLAGVIGLWVISADQSGGPSLLLGDLRQLDVGTTAGRWIFVAFFAAFAVKAPLFPVHTWLADTTEQATPSTSVLLVCILDKIGTFGMLRFCLGLLPEASRWATPVVVALALISIIYGALLAIGQDDLLRLIGLTSLSHFGFITLGIFVISQDGGSAAILYMVNHGLSTGALLFAAGFLLKRHGTVSIRELAGLERQTPVLAGLFLVAGLAALGLPGLAQFVSEVMVIVSAFAWHWYVGALALPAIVLAAVYILWAYQRIFTGPPREPEAAETRHVSQSPYRDLTKREVAVMAPLLGALVLFGFVPGPLFHVANPTVTTILQAGEGR
ncbi:NADH-quinone oxidoreductase subunit M [Nocardioides sp. Kera G14]|uniref:NADH-quinone oxidoreductase subunit M n=1 Tax=Nocardioides sp. Kera G14 TaxID=2884264 RepID=UPI001D1004ED|nr:NADH-quinone oxidoreductase subunit M [Nocardioides sp. Kera G14]UDY23912.1 NADH-quinone oxidoreductase subunit M [Nocardioides sp. Kera G14]